MALWLLQRYSFSLADAATFFFFASLLSGGSQLLSPLLARRIGLIRTMVFTHLPANAFLIAAAFMPTASLAVTFLLLRNSFSQMDVPARQAFVMAMVPPEERAPPPRSRTSRAASARASLPFLSGMLLRSTSFGWPLVIAGSLKIVYDLLLLRGVPAPRSVEVVATRSLGGSGARQRLAGSGLCAGDVRRALAAVAPRPRAHRAPRTPHSESHAK